MLAFNGASNAIVAMSLKKDLNGLGWINVTTIVLEIQDKYAEDQVQCPFIRSKVSEKRTKVKNDHVSFIQYSFNFFIVNIP